MTNVVSPELRPIHRCATNMVRDLAIMMLAIAILVVARAIIVWAGS